MKRAKKIISAVLVFCMVFGTTVVIGEPRYGDGVGGEARMTFNWEPLPPGVDFEYQFMPLMPGEAPRTFYSASTDENVVVVDMSMKQGGIWIRIRTFNAGTEPVMVTINEVSHDGAHSWHSFTYVFHFTVREPEMLEIMDVKIEQDKPKDYLNLGFEILLGEYIAKGIRDGFEPITAGQGWNTAGRWFSDRGQIVDGIVQSTFIDGITYLASDAKRLDAAGNVFSVLTAIPGFIDGVIKIENQTYNQPPTYSITVTVKNFSEHTMDNVAVHAEAWFERDDGSIWRDNFGGRYVVSSYTFRNGRLNPEEEGHVLLWFHPAVFDSSTTIINGVEYYNTVSQTVNIDIYATGSYPGAPEPITTPTMEFPLVIKRGSLTPPPYSPEAWKTANEANRAIQDFQKNVKKFFGYKCPVDVHIFDAEGDLVGTVSNHSTDVITATGLIAFAEGELKFVHITPEKMNDYRIMLEATDYGQMDAFSYEVITDFENGTLSLGALTVFPEVPLMWGQMFDVQVQENNIMQLFKLNDYGERVTELEPLIAALDFQQVLRDFSELERTQSMLDIIFISVGGVLLLAAGAAVFIILNKKKKAREEVEV